MDQSSTHRPPQICRLLELPAELRNHIYESALVYGKHEPGYFALRTTEKSSITEPGLIRTSGQLRAETLPVYHGQNVRVWVVDREDQLAFMDRLPFLGEKLQLMRRIALQTGRVHGVCVRFEVTSGSKTAITAGPREGFGSGERGRGFDLLKWYDCGRGQWVQGRLSERAGGGRGRRVEMFEGLFFPRAGECQSLERLVCRGSTLYEAPSTLRSAG